MEAREYWKKYDSVIKYNNTFKKNYYEAMKVHYDFYNGDQWQGLDESNGLPKTVFNITKRIVDFQIASLTNYDVKVNVEPLENIAEDGEYQVSDFINAEIENIFEKWNMRSLKKEALLDGAISGDMCAHLIFNNRAKPYRGSYPDIQGEIEIELIDSTNIGFGNANIRDVQKQPWIIVIGRDFVKKLKQEAKKDSVINADNDTSNQATDLTEVEIDGDEEGKALYIYIYEKDENGKILVTKCTKDCVIYEKVDTGNSRYPIAFSNWYKQKNTYHGRGQVEGVCPNQMAINKMFAMIVYHQMMTAFPTAVYDGDVLDGWSNRVGDAIKLKGLRSSGRSIKDVAGYLEPANMSDYIIKVIDLCFQYTKECLGVSDASLGNIDPKNTSAIIAVQKSTAVPLENIKDNLYDFIEQIVLNLIDMMGAKYGIRPVVLTKEDGTRVIEQFDFNILKDMDLKSSVDVGETSYFSEIAVLQTLDNLLAQSFIDFEEYLERIPNEILPNKSELISKMREAREANKQQGYEAMAQFMEQLPQEYQNQLQSILAMGWDVTQPQQENKPTGQIIATE